MRILDTVTNEWVEFEQAKKAPAERGRWGMDAITAMGIVFKQPIPKGIEWAGELPNQEELVDYLLEEGGMAELYDNLYLTYEKHIRGRKRSPLSWEQFAEYVHVVTDRKWQPSPEMCESLVSQQRDETSRT